MDGVELAAALPICYNSCRCSDLKGRNKKKGKKKDPEAVAPISLQTNFRLSL